MADCIFCKIVSGQVPSSKVYEDSQVLGFMDAGQVNPGHVIVAVKPHVPYIYDLNADSAAAVFQAAARIAKAVKASMQPAGMTLLHANEKAGWQRLNISTFTCCRATSRMGSPLRGLQRIPPEKSSTDSPRR